MWCGPRASQDICIAVAQRRVYAQASSSWMFGMWSANQDGFQFVVHHENEIQKQPRIFRRCTPQDDSAGRGSGSDSACTDVTASYLSDGIQIT
jgi:hypothetical protein